MTYAKTETGRTLVLFTFLYLIVSFVEANQFTNVSKVGLALLASTAISRHVSIRNANLDLDGNIPYTMKQGIRGTGHFGSDDRLKSHCVQPAICTPLTKSTCLGANLPYKFTSFALTNATSLDEIEQKLSMWKSLQKVPKCWSVIQALLCGVYLPRCDERGLVLPPKELCKMTRGPCRIVELSGGWPDFLQCNHEGKFPIDCKHDVKEIKFNNSASCQPPLVDTDQPLNWYHIVDGCGVQCFNPLVSPEQHSQIHSFIGITGSVCLSFNTFAVLTFLIDWRNSRRYPAIIIFYINSCYMMACIGWLSQFSSAGAREDIVCQQGGTTRTSQPSSGETLSCVTVFILIYYFTMAASIWFVLLSFSWDVSFRSVGVPRKVVENKSSYFHLAAWSLPFVMTIALMAMKEIDSSSIYGICFLGYNNHMIRIMFHLLPLTLAWIGGIFFLCRGFLTLVKVKFGSKNILSHPVKSRIKNMIVRLGIFILFVSTAVVITIICQTLEFLQKEDLRISLEKFVTCLAVHSRNEDHLPCKVQIEPNLLLVHLQLLAMFGTGIIMSSWIWTSATFGSWSRFLFRICNQSANEPVKLKRHKMIAQAFAQRDNFCQGRLSLSYDSTHEDPVGMNLEINSVASRAPSSTWAAALPKFLLRRGALAGSGALGLRRYSSTSDISQCPIHLMPLNGRRHSMDSQNSMQISEHEWIANAQAHVKELARQRRRKTRKEREKCIRGTRRMSPWRIFGRRGSDTSQQSSLNALDQRLLKPKKATKATSTGDLGPNEAFLYRPTTALIFPVARPLLQKQPVIFPPFTHGMEANPARLLRSRKPLMHYPQSNNHSRSGFAIGNGYTIPSNQSMPGWLPYTHLAVPYPAYMSLEPFLPDHEPILPLNPMPDSCSEAEFLPIVMSDSDYTDTGFRTNDEQILNAKFIEQHMNAIVQFQENKLETKRTYSCEEGRPLVEARNEEIGEQVCICSKTKLDTSLASFFSLQRQNSFSSCNHLSKVYRQNSEPILIKGNYVTSNVRFNKLRKKSRSLCFTPFNAKSKRCCAEQDSDNTQELKSYKPKINDDL